MSLDIVDHPPQPPLWQGQDAGAPLADLRRAHYYRPRQRLDVVLVRAFIRCMHSSREEIDQVVPEPVLTV